MIELALLLVIGLVIINSKIWESDEWEKAKFNLWTKKRNGDV